MLRPLQVLGDPAVNIATDPHFVARASPPALLTLLST